MDFGSWIPGFQIKIIRLHPRNLSRRNLGVGIHGSLGFRFFRVFRGPKSLLPPLPPVGPN
jgi:hypothetical protein